jgi:hypothetical protein
MRSRIIITMIAISLALMVGCSATARMVTAKSQSERTDVFTEMTDDDGMSQGFAGLIVKANIKTHEAGHYIGESGKSLHGKPGYPFVLNIDGQAAVWKVNGQKDVKPAYDEQGKTSRDSEAKTGIKYILEKKLRLRHGMHKVYFGLPEDEYCVEAEITLRDGEEAVLEFKPIYRYKTLPTRIPTFLEGINKYEIYLNGVKVNESVQNVFLRNS